MIRPYRDIVADLEKGKNNNLLDHSRPQSYLRNAGAGGLVTNNQVGPVTVDQHALVAGVAPDVLPTGSLVRGTSHVGVATSTGAGFRVVDPHVVRGQEAESYSAAVPAETNTGGEQRRLVGESAIKASTVTRPVRERREPYFLVVGDVNDPRFGRKHGE